MDRTTPEPWEEPSLDLDDALMRCKRATTPKARRNAITAARIAYEALGDVLDQLADEADEEKAVAA
jgi:hypothetical protein